MVVACEANETLNRESTEDGGNAPNNCSTATDYHGVPILALRCHLWFATTRTLAGGLVAGSE